MKYLVLVIMCSWILVSCSGRGKGKVKIGLVMKTLSNPFFITMEKGAKEEAERLGIDLVVQTPSKETDFEKQAQIVENMILMKMDAILIAPAASKELVSVLLKANRAGIPVLNLDNPLDAEAIKEMGLKVESYVGADNEAGGKLCGEHLAKVLGGKGKVAILEGIPGTLNAEARKRGFLKAVAKHPDIEVVASQTAHWVMEEALDVFSAILQSHPEINGLFCANDMMALGALKAIEKAGKDVKVVSYDNLDVVKPLIKEGKILGSVEQFPDSMGIYGVRLAVDLLKGKEIPKELMVNLEINTEG
jgi:ribose transport system substrate-binding protein